MAPVLRMGPGSLLVSWSFGFLFYQEKIPRAEDVAGLAECLSSMHEALL